MANLGTGKVQALKFQEIEKENLGRHIYENSLYKKLLKFILLKMGFIHYSKQ
ncbi:MAG: hypothetical protein JSV88_08145 [Candidatus Aminicenantes bacterium]|nr:MAG: hypothetical protein JSV88_08145 [Candidatus Aminicenantes bacterium]